jgi:hypothetical protein
MPLQWHFIGQINDIMGMGMTMMQPILQHQILDAVPVSSQVIKSNLKAKAAQQGRGERKQNKTACLKFIISSILLVTGS